MESNSFYSPWMIELNWMDSTSAFFALAALHPVHHTGGMVTGKSIFVMTKCWVPIPAFNNMRRFYNLGMG